MKLYRYKFVPVAILSTMIFSILSVSLSYSLSLLVVQNISELFKNFVIVFLIYVLHSLSLFWNLKTVAKAETYLQQVLSQQVDKYFADMKFENFHAKDHGERLSLYINDIPKVIELTFGKYISRIKMATTAVASFLALVNMHFSLGIIAILAFVFMSTIPKLFQAKLRNYISGVQKEKAEYTSKMRELLQGYTTFFENLAFPVFFKKSSIAIKKYADYQLQTNVFTSLMSAILTFINGFVSAISVAYVAYLMLNNQVKAGTLLAVLSLVPSFGSSVIQFLSEGEFYKSGLSLFQEKFDFAQNDYDLKSLPSVNKRSLVIHDTSIQTMQLADIKLDYGKCFTFPNLTFHAGKKYAIMGKSGSGKSSLVKILVGEIEHYQGEVLLNDHRKGKSDHLFDYVSYMNQTTFLFNDTIKNNIDLLNQMSEEEVQLLLDKVGLNTLRSDYIIQDNGKNLSGGQRQRLAFARAIARNKKILILDEATANLDQDSANLLENLALTSGYTLIMITHHMTDDLRTQLDEIITI